MDKIVITNQVQQQDSKYKISFKATFVNDSYISGHIFIEQDALEEMSMKDIRKVIANDLVNNLGEIAE